LHSFSVQNIQSSNVVQSTCSSPRMSLIIHCRPY